MLLLSTVCNWCQLPVLAALNVLQVAYKVLLATMASESTSNYLCPRACYVMHAVGCIG
jgi:hypothetical protein